MLTTAEVEVRTGISQRVVQKRIKRLGLKVRRVGRVQQLTTSQVDKIINYEPPKPGPKKR